MAQAEIVLSGTGTRDDPECPAHCNSCKLVDGNGSLQERVFSSQGFITVHMLVRTKKLREDSGASIRTRVPGNFGDLFSKRSERISRFGEPCQHSPTRLLGLPPTAASRPGAQFLLRLLCSVSHLRIFSCHLQPTARSILLKNI